MAMVINSNIQSLNAQRHLNNSLDAQNTATERLSSGLRINSAKDDAAGLAIANRMTSQVEGLNQAIRNANDGAALIQTAEGGLEEMTSILQRMRELSIQSANGTYDTGNRDTINAEAEQLKQEITRIAETTSFNGLNILDGSLGEVDLQVGENANQTIGLEIGSLTTNNLGANGGDLIGAAMTLALSTQLDLIDDDDLTINGDVVASLTTGTTVTDKLELLSNSVAGVDVSAFVELEGGLATGGNGSLQGDDEIIFTLAMQDGGTDQVISIKDTTDMADLVSKINEEGKGLINATIGDEGQLIVNSESASSIAVTGAGDGLANAGLTAATQFAQLKFEITDSDVTDIEIKAGAPADLNLLGLNVVGDDGSISGTVIATGAALGGDQLVLNGVSIDAATATTAAAIMIQVNKVSDESGVTASAGTITGALKFSSTDGSAVRISSGDGFTGAGNATEQQRDQALFDAIGVRVTNDSETSTNTVQNIDLSTAEGAQKAIGVLTEAIGQVSEVRGDLGAISNRLDHTTRNLSNISENAANARSAIMDADFAAESANLSRAQVLQQAGNAMLAQANSRPQQVLSLLQ